MERGDLVCHINLSHKPAGATLYATYAHTNTSRLPLHSISVWQAYKIHALFLVQCFIWLSLHYSHIGATGFMAVEVLTHTDILKGEMSIARGRRHDYFAGDLHSLFRRACQWENIAQVDVLSSGVGPGGHPQTKREVSRELDTRTQSHCVLKAAS